MTPASDLAGPSGRGGASAPAADRSGRGGLPGRARSRAFTLIEIMMGLFIVLAMIGGAFTMYSRGNKAAAKGTWRVNTVKRQRTALRQVKDYLEKTSYPSVIRLNDYLELSPDYPSTGAGSDDYVLALASGTPVPISTSPNEYVKYDAEGEVMTFYDCQPRQELEGLATALNVVPGSATRVVLSLVPATGSSSRLDLAVTTSAATVDSGAGSVTVGGFDDGTPRVLLNDVSEVSVGVSPVSSTQDKSVVEFSVVCADPFDGRLSVRETAKAEINVRVRK